MTKFYNSHWNNVAYASLYEKSMEEVNVFAQK